MPPGSLVSLETDPNPTQVPDILREGPLWSFYTSVVPTDDPYVDLSVPFLLPPVVPGGFPDLRRVSPGGSSTVE